MGEETGANVLLDLSRTQQFVEMLETGKILNDRYQKKLNKLQKIKLIKIKQNLIISGKIKQCRTNDKKNNYD